MFYVLFESITVSKYFTLFRNKKKENRFYHNLKSSRNFTSLSYNVTHCFLQRLALSRVIITYHTVELNPTNNVAKLRKESYSEKFLKLTASLKC